MLYYNYFDEHYPIIVVDLSKKKALEADPKAIQQIRFTGNLEQYEGATIFFIVKQVKETILDLLQGKILKGAVSRNVLRHFRWFIRGPLPTGKGTIRAGEGTIGAVQYFEWCLVLWKILKLKSIIKINLGNYLTKKKDGAYWINLDEFK